MSALLLLLTGLTLANPGRVIDCLNAVDVPCAEREIAKLSPESSTDPDVLYAAARTNFFAGRNEQAYNFMARAVEAGHDDRWDELGLYDRTRKVTADFKVVRRGHLVLRYRPGLDAVLVEEALHAMESSERVLAPLLGGPAPGDIVVEVYPNGRTFTEASSLTEKDIKTTGVIALSKWSRLLLTSPRALGRGYDWQDTIAHEYIHQVVSHRTQDRSPVWLQEAIAKYLDNRWRDGKDNFHLDPRSEGLLAKAIRQDKLVPFDRMHPSLAKLPSAEMADLAYSQLASLMQFCFEHSDEDVLLRALPDVGGMIDPRVALAKAAGFDSFAALEGAWKTWIRSRDLRENDASRLPTAPDANDTTAGDPVMANRKDLARFLRLGELLAQRGHHDAALLEYNKADDKSAEQSPLLQTRIAESYLAKGELRDARALLEQTLALYPHFTHAWVALGELELTSGNMGPAREAYAKAASFNPYNALVHRKLIALYRSGGDTARAQRHADQLRILERGGEG